MTRPAGIVLAVCACVAAAQPLPDPVRMRSDLVYLTSDKLKGRRSMEPGAEKAARFVADEFKKAGLTPASGNSYFQEYNVAVHEMPGKARLRVHSEGKAFECGFSLDFPINYSARAPLVFTGFGITETGYDDYAGVDVRGKIVMVFDPVPEGFPGGQNSGLRSKALNAQKHGAVGLVAVHIQQQKPQQRPDQQAPSKAAQVKPQMQMLNPDDLRIPAFRMMEGDGKNMLAASGKPADKLIESIVSKRKPGSFPMPLFEVELQSGGGMKRSGRSFNVVGMIEGSDQALRNETVLICAHYDHLGTNKGKIFRGANDNGSGTAALLEIARLFQQSGVRPRRSVVFAAFGSEEQGLLGSRYYVMNPLRPVAGTVALNIDMVAGPERPNEIDLVAGRLSPELRQTVLRQNQAVGLQIVDIYEPSLLTRSDHHPFIVAGAPAVQFFGGTGPDYHQPTDTVQRLDFEKLAKVARLAHLSAVELANAAALPRLN